MDLRRVGRVVRAVRVHLQLRQDDLAATSDISQSAISRLEAGLAAGMSVGDIARVADVLDIRLTLDAWWRGGDVSRLLDADHATLVDLIVGRLRVLGWKVLLEYGFNHVGERGSVDVDPRDRPGRTTKRVSANPPRLVVRSRSTRSAPGATHEAG